jgi:hypothetical protein
MWMSMKGLRKFNHQGMPASPSSTVKTIVKELLHAASVVKKLHAQMGPLPSVRLCGLAARICRFAASAWQMPAPSFAPS